MSFTLPMQRVVEEVVETQPELASLFIQRCEKDPTTGAILSETAIQTTFKKVDANGRWDESFKEKNELMEDLLTASDPRLRVFATAVRAALLSAVVPSVADPTKGITQELVDFWTEIGIAGKAVVEGGRIAQLKYDEWKAAQ
jgi:hypothetical protein